MFSKQALIIAGYKSNLRLIVRFGKSRLGVWASENTRISVLVNALLQTTKLDLDIKLMERAKAKINVNSIMAPGAVSCKTNAIPIGKFVDVRLVYAVTLQKHGSVLVKPNFELKGLTSKCIHSVTINGNEEDITFIANRLMTIEEINSVNLYAKCIT